MIQKKNKNKKYICYTIFNAHGNKKKKIIVLSDIILLIL